MVNKNKAPRVLQAPVERNQRPKPLAVPRRHTGPDASNGRRSRGPRLDDCGAAKPNGSAATSAAVARTCNRITGRRPTAFRTTISATAATPRSSRGAFPREPTPSARTGPVRKPCPTTVIPNLTPACCPTPATAPRNRCTAILARPASASEHSGRNTFAQFITSGLEDQQP